MNKEQCDCKDGATSWFGVREFYRVNLVAVSHKL